MGFGDYFYYLAHRIFKRAPRENNDLDKFTRGIGSVYDRAKEAIFKLREQALIITASGKALDQHGRDRNMPRFPGESDDKYRLRLLKAFSYYEQLGTKEHMLEVLRGLGYKDCDIDELYLTDPERWAEFIIRITDPFIELDCKLIRYTANKLKPAHTKMASITQEGTWGINLLPAFRQVPVPYPLCNIEQTAALAGIGLHLQLPLGSVAKLVSWEYSPCGTVQTAGQPGQGCFATLNAGANVVTKAWEYDLAGEAMPAGDKGYPLAGGMSLEMFFTPVSWGYEMCGQITARSDVA
ncbi:hypothetical protein [Pelotomaculum propionicicum]|uniref:Uncharacterized protein n=1 Tax=Pelotomaculum propionicicum TaxID=258475 RepID=A0A4Y7RJZ8_9FIRM|nr:hypothetical protein [Pelotomaculum propionicicum]TEB09131.1 hypothetical protein Pmgp_03352 [Pelotomaculum propionicicum]